MKIFNYRLIIFTLSIIFGVVFSIPSILQTDTGKKNLIGIRFTRWITYAFRCKYTWSSNSKIKTIATSVKYFSDDEELLIDGLSIRNESVVFFVLDADEIPKMDEMLKQIKGLDISKDELKYTLKLTAEDIVKKRFSCCTSCWNNKK